MYTFLCFFINFSNVLVQDLNMVGVDNNMQASAPKVHELIVVDPIPIENVYGRDTLLLECSASGYPAPKITWSFNGVIFVKGVPFGKDLNNPEGSEVTGTVRHTFEGNRLMIKNVKGKTNGDKKYYDSGRYRCIATNQVGAVFLEKNIQIRVMGKFSFGNRYNNEAKKWNPTVGRSFTIKCPDHVAGYGTEYAWGEVNSANRLVTLWGPGDPNERVFQDGEGSLVYSVVLDDDITESRNNGGLRCILMNYGIVKESNQQLLWQAYSKTSETRKPVLVAFMESVMEVPVDSGYAMTCGATGSPVPKITWEYQGIPIVSKTPGSKEVNFEFFELHGDGMELKIRRITQYSGGTFRCYAENSLGKVWEDGQLVVQFPPEWMALFPETINLPYGNKFELICNATGIPRPKIEWFQNATRIINTDRKYGVGDRDNDNGGLLTITSASFKDNGIYICVALNPLDTITQSVFIKVEEIAPSFKEKPVDDPIYLFRTATMLIHCDPKGGPVPQKTWKKIDRFGVETKIEDGGRFKILSNGSLQITNVKMSDGGRYECTAINKLGKDVSSGEAVILEPTIITEPPENRQYAAGWQYARLFCGASWDHRLDLRIDWYKGGSLMTNFNDDIYLEGRSIGPPRLLYFHHLKVTDAGKYSCHAYAEVAGVKSEQWAHAVLSIKAPPEPPAGVSIALPTEKHPGCQAFNALLTWSRGEEIGVLTARFFIEFSTPSEDKHGRWYGGEGDKLIPGSRIVAPEGTQVQFPLNQAHLMPGNDLIFRVTAMADPKLMGRPSRASNKEECITPPGKPRLNPVDVHSVVDGPGLLSIHWRALPSVYHGGPNYRYLVYYRQVTSPPATWTEKIITDLNVTEEIIDNPGKYVRYEFYVQSRNELGDGPEIKSPYPSNYSGRDPPTTTPGNFRIIQLSRFSVDLGWNPVSDAEYYRVRYLENIAHVTFSRKKGTSQDVDVKNQVKYWNITNAEHLRGHTHNRNKRSTDEQKSIYQYTEFIGDTYDDGGSLRNLTAQVAFLVQVQACNNGGCGPYGDTVSFTSPARVPSVPRDVNIQVYGDSALINWSPPLEPNGYIETYEIFWYESGADQTGQSASQRRSIIKGRRDREVYLVQRFKPMVYYNVFLTAVNRVGPGQDWSQILFAVSAPDIPGKPGAPLAVPYDDSSINITFQRSTYGGLPTKFLVYYRPRGDYFGTPVIVEQRYPELAWVLVTGLEFIVYDFWTVGVNSLGVSETSDATEEQPIRRPKPQAHASEFEWWRSNWFIAIMMCILFTLLTMVTVVMLLKDGVNAYEPLKEEKRGKNTGGGGGLGTSGYRSHAMMQIPSNQQEQQRQQPLVLTPRSAAIQANTFGGGNSSKQINGLGTKNQPTTSSEKTPLYEETKNFSVSDLQSDHDGPPPKYQSRSSLDKGDGESLTGSSTGTDYSGSETGSDDSDYSEEEDGSYYSDEEKRAFSDTDEGEIDDFASFV